MAKAPAIGLFGAALVPGAEVQHSDEEVALYAAEARIDDVVSFYQAVYGKTEGLQVQADGEGEQRNVIITATPKCEDAAFAMISASAVPKQRKQVQIIVTARVEDEDEKPRMDNPWDMRNKPK